MTVAASNVDPMALHSHHHRLHHKRKFYRIYRRRGHSRSKFLQSTVAGQLHAIAVLCVVGGLIGLLPKMASASVEMIVGTVIFGVMGLGLFATSALYHFMYDGYMMRRRIAALFERLDRTFIYLFIAGTYTPIVLKVVADPTRTHLLLWIWFWALVGVAMTNFASAFPAWAQYRAVYVTVYLCMGWSFIGCFHDMIHGLSHAQMSWLIRGGVAYSVGAVIYGFKRPNPFPNFFGYHEIWHALVLLGFGCHFALIASLY